MFEGLFSQFVSDCAKYVFYATVLSSSSIRFLFFCSKYFPRRFRSSLKLWFRYLSWKLQFNFNQINLLLKLLRKTFYIIFKSLVWISFVEATIWTLKFWYEGIFSQFDADYAKYVSNATVLFLVQAQTDCSCAQTVSNDLLYHL